MLEEYTFVERAPTVEEFRALCVAVGWEQYMNFKVAEISLRNTLYHLVVEREGQSVGMGRIIGDGAIFFYIQDIIVQPEHQGRGLGQKIMTGLMEWLKEHAPDKALVALFAVDGTQSFYKRFGFTLEGNDLIGMYCVTPLK